MSNRIKKRDNNFTQVSNSFLRDNNISFKAKGLFCYMFSMNENWNFTLQSIATQQKDGLDLVKSAMDELKQYGYVTYEKLANGKGLYYLDDEPKVENPNVENPNLGKSTPIKNNNSTKNKNSKNLIDSFFEDNEDCKRNDVTEKMIIDFIEYRKSIKKPIKTTKALRGFYLNVKDLYDNKFSIVKCLEEMKLKEWLTVDKKYFKDRDDLLDKPKPAFKYESGL